MTTTKSRDRADAIVEGGKPTNRTARDGLGLLELRVPASLGYRFDEAIDRRQLRCGEKEALVTLLTDAEPQTRYAAAYVAMKLGITEAVPVMDEALEKRHEANESVRELFRCAISQLRQMERSKTLPAPETQLMMLLQMREGNDSPERVLADIVIRKADIKYGMVASF